jgi:hypothetical protein
LIRRAAARQPGARYQPPKSLEESTISAIDIRVQSGGKPLRVFYAFDPRRMAILLIGGDKMGDKRFCDRMIPLADALYDEHLAELAKEKDDGR